MRTLADRLDQIRAGFADRAPAEAREIMGRATADLRDSGILERIPAPGDKLVPFELPDTEGGRMRSAELLAHGPLVITVYRGFW